MTRPARLYGALVLGSLLALMLAACGGTGGVGSAATPVPATGGERPTAMAEQPTTAVASATGTLRVGSKDFTEEFIVAEMYAQLLEDAGFTVEKKLNLGGTPIAHTAILNGDIDLYPEYTSTGLLEVLKKEPIKDAGEIVTTVRQTYEQQFQLTWLEPAPFNNSNTFAVTQETAGKYGLKTFSDLFANASQLRLGGPAEFPERGDTKSLEQVYGAQISSFKEFKQLGTGSLRYDALKNGEVDVIVAFGTDGRIAGDNLVVLEDDKGAYPIYQIAPVVRMDVLEQNPQIAEALNRLAPLLTDDAMRRLNAQVDVEGKEPADVARAFLQEQGLLN